MWKRTNLEDAHENSLVSSRIRCLKTRVRFVDKILFFPVQLQLFKEKQQRILTNIQGLPTHTYVCTDFTYQNQHVLNYYSCFWCLTSLPFFERKVDFCVFTCKKNIVELKKPKHEENNMIWKYIGEVLLPLKCSSFFLLATLAARCKTPVERQFGSILGREKTRFWVHFFPVNLFGKGRATVGKSQYLILLPLDCVCSTSCIGEAWRFHQKGRWVRQTNEVGGIVGWFFWTLKFFVGWKPKKNQMLNRLC